MTPRHCEHTRPMSRPGRPGSGCRAQCRPGSGPAPIPSRPNVAHAPQTEVQYAGPRLLTHYRLTPGRRPSHRGGHGDSLPVLRLRVTHSQPSPAARRRLEGSFRIARVPGPPGPGTRHKYTGPGRDTSTPGRDTGPGLAMKSGAWKMLGRLRVSLSLSLSPSLATGLSESSTGQESDLNRAGRRDTGPGLAMKSGAAWKMLGRLRVSLSLSLSLSLATRLSESST
jgi:hypothetical protein